MCWTLFLIQQWNKQPAKCSNFSACSLNRPGNWLSRCKLYLNFWSKCLASSPFSLPREAPLSCSGLQPFQGYIFWGNNWAVDWQGALTSKTCIIRFRTLAWCQFCVNIWKGLSKMEPGSQLRPFWSCLKRTWSAQLHRVMGSCMFNEVVSA